MINYMMEMRLTVFKTKKHSKTRWKALELFLDRFICFRKFLFCFSFSSLIFCTRHSLAKTVVTRSMIKRKLSAIEIFEFVP